MKKYELTGECKVYFGVTLRRIKSLIDFSDVKKGELGGFIEKEENLSHENNAWVYGNARVSGNARVYGDAWVSSDAWVYGDADYVLIGRIGSRFGFTTFFRNKNNEIYVSCGCFLGTLAKFRKKVKETHGTDTKYAKVYQAAADLAEMQILNK